MASIATDRRIIETIGDDALIARAVPAHCVKAWKYRGIPWKDRAKVARIAADQSIDLPANFIEEKPRKRAALKKRRAP
jgi:hypothetical protein